MTLLTRRIRPTTKLAFDFANIRVNHRTASRSADDQRPVNANSAASEAAVPIVASGTAHTALEAGYRRRRRVPRG